MKTSKVYEMRIEKKDDLETILDRDRKFVTVLDNTPLTNNEFFKKYYNGIKEQFKLNSKISVSLSKLTDEELVIAFIDNDSGETSFNHYKILQSKYANVLDI